MSNGSSIPEVLLLTLTVRRELQLWHFWLFLGISLAALPGNGLSITAIACDHRLHAPSHSRAFSPHHHVLRPLRCHLQTPALGTLLGSRACVHMAAAAWGTGLLSSLLHTANTFSLSFYQGKTREHFFCETPQILKLSRCRSHLREVGLIVVTACLFLGWFVLAVVSYVQVSRAVLRIPSGRGWEEPAGKGTQDWRGVRDTLGKNSRGGSGAAPCEPWSCPERPWLLSTGEWWERAQQQGSPSSGSCSPPSSTARAESPHGPGAPQPSGSAGQHRQSRALRGARVAPGVAGQPSPCPLARGKALESRGGSGEERGSVSVPAGRNP